MAFQTSVGADMPWGIPGELALGLAQNVRAEPVFLNVTLNGDPAQAPIFGRAMTMVESADLGAGADAGSGTIAQFGGTTAFLGILANPKAAVGYTSLGGVAPGLEAGTALEVVSECPGIWVRLTSSAKVGDGVAYLSATTDPKVAGTLKAAPAQVAPSGHVLIPGSRVVRFDVNTGLAMIALQQLPTPAVAP